MDCVENDASNNPYTVACIRCHGNVFAKPLPSIDGGDTHTDIQIDERDFFKYAVEMGSNTMIHIPSFMQIGSGIQKLIEGHVQTAGWSHKPAFIFSK